MMSSVAQLLLASVLRRIVGKKLQVCWMAINAFGSSVLLGEFEAEREHLLLGWSVCQLDF